MNKNQEQEPEDLQAWRKFQSGRSAKSIAKHAMLDDSGVGISTVLKMVLDIDIEFRRGLLFSGKGERNTLQPPTTNKKLEEFLRQTPTDTYLRDTSLEGWLETP
jgi:ABC-type iron transport system FetAB ATPase subunit